MRKHPIYMDNHATTRTDPRVVACMMPFFEEQYGNAGSATHAYGWHAADACEDARGGIARFLGARHDEIVVTSGATEANNLAIKGLAASRGDQGHLVTSAIEHKSVLESFGRLERQGWHVTTLPVDRYGRVDPMSLKRSLCDDTALVSIMAANNEVGTLQRIAEIGAMCRERGVPFHSDATQAAGRVPVNVVALNVDMLSFSAHKIYGPKGVGALYVRGQSPPIRLDRILDGGSQERGLRAGTLAVPLIVGFARACELCGEEMAEEVPRIRGLRDRLYHGVRAEIPMVQLNGQPTERLAGNLSLSFPRVEPAALMLHLRELAVSSTSACASAEARPSHVLTAMGVAPELAAATIRFGLGRFTTEDEVEYAIMTVVRAADRAGVAAPFRPATQFERALVVGQA